VAVHRSEEKVETSKQKAMLFDRWKSIAMSERQVTMINRLLGGFDGKLTAKKWAQLCKCSHDTALRDIDDLISKGVLKRGTAGGRSTSYELIL
jgi:Fic family protein